MKKRERFLTAIQAKVLDKKALDRFGISTLVLMENAGRAISEEVLKVLQKRAGKVAICCGTGNNGGDGLCACRHLLTAGIKPEVYLIGKIVDLKNEAKINSNILLKLKQRITQINPGNIHLLKAKIKKYSLIIDALLGVGISKEIRPVYQEVIDLINASKAYVISVDIPSGLDATTGKALGRCIKADKTITFVTKKLGMSSGAGKSFSGRVLVRDIGINLLNRVG